jgi:hypothetical protein
MTSADIFKYIDYEMKRLGYHDYDMEPYKIYDPHPAVGSGYRIIEEAADQAFYFLCFSENHTNAVGTEISAENRYYKIESRYEQLIFMNYFTGAEINITYNPVDAAVPIILDFIKVQPRKTQREHKHIEASLEHTKEQKSENFLTRILEKFHIKKD